ncbi:MAG: TerB family tellurite resistance protein [Bacteroidales bacterium]|nr:TerB family tellurite resistance protein [Bacteroidales bacterium]
MDRIELYLKTAFCCMACDGEIAPAEMEKIKTLPHFKEINLQKMLSEYLLQLQKEGNRFLKKYLDEVKSAVLTEEEECELASIAIQTIEVDKSIEYNEVAFFKKIRKRLKLTNEKLLTAIPENPDVIDQISPEDYLLPDITDEDDLSLWTDTFSNISGSYSA